MVTKLYRYKIPWRNAFREGLILSHNGGLGEIAPLPGFSKETLQEALDETLSWIRTQKKVELPSVSWGIQCTQKKIKPVHIPLCALGAKSDFTTVKLKLGHLSLDKAIHLVQKHLGKFKIRLDCNRAWSLESALEFAKHFRKSDFLYLEEPTKTFEELLEFSKITNFPIAIDESIHCDWSKIPSLKAVVVKPTVVGTITQVPPHLNLILSSSYESGLGLLHIANMAKTSLPMGLDTVHSEDLLLKPIQSQSGIFHWDGSDPILDMSKLCAL
ncbi:MAG: hypothetical protein COT85_02995 [Chlamydiae bacterium CG10_big_fil_rev_8_21_14_0_10_42_34]|nr:MAG: hypothetical protein COT85_02995 [Chlamydiae bacterium CG10_big_fil_rev_8_21_14_0_10_42_34]